jgi:hypothetical protein
MRAPGIPAPPEVFRQFLQAGKAFRQMGKQWLLRYRVFSIIGNLPGNDVAIAGIDVDRLLFQVLFHHARFRENPLMASTTGFNIS